MAEKILESRSSEQFKTDYTRYSIYISFRRVLSDYKDGLKPVQRRILWAMYKNTKAITTKVKSAAVVGDVMKLYHPHGDCLDGDTILYNRSTGGYITIKEAYESKLKSLDVYAIDPETGCLVNAVATNFRIGQYTLKKYKVFLSNGSIINCTDNHPFMLAKKCEFVKARDLKIGDELFTVVMATSNKKNKIDGSDNYKKLFVTEVQIDYVNNLPMYDFTVDKYENMLIPVSSHSIDHVYEIGMNKKEFISVHNSAIYGTMKPMTNWFETYLPLIDGEGNFGTFQGDQAAASRYTLCRLSKFALENVLEDVIESPEAVDWSPTYDETTKEPDYLPVKVPLLLINGSFGIGVGTRADIPTHNLNEVIDATLMLMDNPNAEVVLAPDHCMNCEIFETDFEKICRSGFGHYKVRGKIDIEQYKGRNALVIKSVPNLTYLNSITDKIEDLIKNKKIIQIENCFDESTVSNMRYVIVLKPGSDPNYVKNVIYKNTSLEQSLRVNFQTLDGLKPLRMSYKSYLLSFIDFRKMTKFRVYSNRLQAVQTKIHEREAYIKALESGEIDNIINIIKSQKTVDDNYLIEYLIKKLKITDLQAKYIIDSDLKKLSLGYLEKYKAEAIELECIKSELMTHIMDDKVIENDIRQELLSIKAKYGKPRNCPIISSDTDSDIPKGEMLIAITEKNFIRKMPSNSSIDQVSAISKFKNDSLRTLIKIDNTDSILIFDEMGRVFKLQVHKIPFTDKNTNGTDIRFLVKPLTANISTVIPESVVKNLSDKGHHNNKHYLVTLSNNGCIKRMDLDDFVTVPPSGIMYAKLDSGDFVKDIVIAHSKFSLVVYSDRKAVIMGVNDTPYLKRNTKGSKAMSNVDHVDGVCVIHNNCTDIAVITESGKINRINIVNGIPNSTKGKSGSNLIKLSNGDKIVGVLSGNLYDIIHIMTTNTSMSLQFADLEIGSSISAGQKVLATRGNKIIRCYVESNDHQ